MLNSASMQNLACKAVHEIQQQRLTLSDFTYPHVWDSEVWEQYGIGIAHLRHHLRTCTYCCLAGERARQQLREFDDRRFEHISAALTGIEKLFDQDLQRADTLARDQAKDIAAGLLRAETPIEDHSPQMAFLAQASIDATRSAEYYRLKSEAEDRIYCRAITLQLLMARIVASWLETFTHPCVDRLVDDLGLVPDCALWYVDFGSTDCSFWSFADAGEESINALAWLIRTMLLDEAFGEMFAPTVTQLLQVFQGGRTGVDQERAQEHSVTASDIEQLSSTRPTTLNWKTIFIHYSEMARLIVASRRSNRLLARGSDADALGKLVRLLEPFVARSDDFYAAQLSGQTAMMDSLQRIEANEAAVLRVLCNYENASQQEKSSCEDRIRVALGGVFARLSDDARRFLLSAEWDYAHRPRNQDFSGTVVAYMKAFETECKRALEPVRKGLEQLLIGNPRNGKLLSKLTLGQLLRLFKDERLTAVTLLRQVGIAYDEFVNAIEAVNKHAGSKHTDSTSHIQASSMRSLLLDSALRKVIVGASSAAR